MYGLPAEIWCRIVAHVSMPTEQNWHVEGVVSEKSYLSFCALSKTCTYMRSIAVWAMYRDIFLRPQVGDKFLKSLLETPSLSKAVKSIQIWDWDSEVMQEERPESLWKILHNPDFSVETPEEEFKALSATPRDAMTFLLCLLNNLELLQIEANYSELKFHRYIAVRERDNQAWTKGQILPNLKELRIKNFLCIKFADFDSAWMLCCHPGIKRLGICGFYWQEEKMNPVHSRQLVARSVETLDIRDSFLSVDGFSRLFVCFPSLRNLSIEYSDGTRATNSAMVGDITKSAAGEILRDHGQNLESLDFDMMRYDEWVNSLTRVGSPGALGSLASLTSLKRLRISRDILLGARVENALADNSRSPPPRLRDALPKSLQRLELCPHETIGSCKDPWYEHEDLEECVELMKDEEFSQLREIKFQFSGDIPESVRDIFKDLLKVRGWKITLPGKMDVVFRGHAICSHNSVTITKR